MSNFVEEKIVKICKMESFLSRLMRAQFITKISFLSMSDLSMKMQEEMLIIKSLLETTCGEDIFNEVMQ